MPFAYAVCPICLIPLANIFYHVHQQRISHKSWNLQAGNAATLQHIYVTYTLSPRYPLAEKEADDQSIPSRSPSVAILELLVEKSRQATAPISTVPTLLALSIPFSAPPCVGARFYTSCLTPQSLDPQAMQFLPSYPFAGLQHLPQRISRLKSFFLALPQPAQAALASSPLFFNLSLGTCLFAAVLNATELCGVFA